VSDVVDVIWLDYSGLFRGVSRIRLVDFDYVTLSSLNRHATAGLTDVGTPKVKSIERTLKHISRCVEVDARIDIWRKEEGGILLEGADWVIGSWFMLVVVVICVSHHTV
jgi:tRNA threonylcarbamoyladenosine dehydratase